MKRNLPQITLSIVEIKAQHFVKMGSDTAADEESADLLPPAEDKLGAVEDGALFRAHLAAQFMQSPDSPGEIKTKIHYIKGIDNEVSQVPWAGAAQFRFAQLGIVEEGGQTGVRHQQLKVGVKAEYPVEFTAENVQGGVCVASPVCQSFYHRGDAVRGKFGYDGCPALENAVYTGYSEGAEERGNAAVNGYGHRDGEYGAEDVAGGDDGGQAANKIVAGDVDSVSHAHDCVEQQWTGGGIDAHAVVEEYGLYQPVE